MQKETNQLTSSRSIGTRDINATSAVSVSRIKTLQDNGKCKGFTLLEMLVVVLIIAILGAIAWPQYQKAVERSRAIEAITLLKTLQQAQLAYYMTHGTYATKFADLDVQFSWTGNTKFLPYTATDTRSNKYWSVQIEPYQSYFTLFAVRISGPYKGAGFLINLHHTTQQQIFCLERLKDANFIFNPSLSTGAYCEKIIHSKWSSQDQWARTYKLHF